MGLKIHLGSFGGWGRGRSGSSRLLRQQEYIYTMSSPAEAEVHGVGLKSCDRLPAVGMHHLHSPCCSSDKPPVITPACGCLKPAKKARQDYTASPMVACKRQAGRQRAPRRSKKPVAHVAIQLAQVFSDIIMTSTSLLMLAHECSFGSVHC